MLGSYLQHEIEKQVKPGFTNYRRDIQPKNSNFVERIQCFLKEFKIMQNEWTKWKLMELVKINENNLMELMKN